MIKIEQVELDTNDLLQPIAQVRLSINLEDIQDTMAIHGPEFLKELQSMIGEIILDSVNAKKEHFGVKE